MKILSCSVINNQQNLNSNQQTGYRQYGLKQDTFQRSSSPSFKGDISDSARDILDNPDKLTGFAAFMAAGFAALQRLAGRTQKDDTNTAESSSVSDVLVNVYVNRKDAENELEDKESKIENLTREKENLAQKNNELAKQNNELAQKNNELAQENNELKENQKEFSKDDEQKTESMPVETDEKPEKPFSFPKKRGRLSYNQQALKDVTEPLVLNESAKAELFLVCMELLNKNTHEIDGKTFTNDELAGTLAKELSENKEDSKNIEKIIDNFAINCGVKQAEPSKNENNVTENTENNSIDTPSRKRISVREQRPSRMKIMKDNTDASGNISFRFKWQKSTDSKGVLNKMTDLFELLMYQKYKDGLIEKPKWKCNEPIGTHVTPEEIKNECFKQRKVNQTRAFNNINASNAYLVADIIENDPRYNEHFSLHGAMRLIDKFVNFNSDEPVEEQSKKVLDCTMELIKDAAYYGVKVDPYQDINNKYGLRMIIPTDYYSNDMQQIFGNKPLVIALSECQEGSRYDTERKEGIISTVFPCTD